jgi:hypothetical protein
MKKVKFFGLAGIILLASGAGFSSCSSDSADPTGGTGVAGQVVKAQFAINIPYGNNSSANQAKKVTRMTADMTQQNSNFRGISDIVLLTFSGDPATTTSITDATSIINIGTDGNAYAQDNYRRLYRDIEIPVGTSHIAFYGKATKNGESSFKTGEITDEGTSGKTLANISHKLTPINSDADFKTDEDATAIIKALNDIANAKVTENGTDYTWANIGSVSVPPSWLTGHEQEFLDNRYKAFIGLKAGSKTSVKACIKSLMEALAGETPEAGVPDTKKLTAEIYKKCQAALDKINTLREFPRNLNLPDGVAALSWNTGESKFAYSNPGNELFSTGNTINYKKICYPAELSYFVNTKTMVSNNDMSNLNEFPSYENWIKNTGADWQGKNFTEDPVTNTTKTVGLKDPVQYSVAVLKSTVKCDAAKLEDNAKQAGKLEADQQITVPTDGFPVTSILVGGQPASVNWKYEPASSETFEYTIYDKVMNGGTLYAKNESTTPTTGNYTLVFDNKNASNKVVFVTIELENKSGMDFYGQDGIIPKDAKFYLVGKLDPTGKTESDHVFVQDHITKANFNIKTLKGAYNCIPDLRTSGINVGLAVDLSWQNGITFDVEL